MPGVCQPDAIVTLFLSVTISVPRAADVVPNWALPAFALVLKASFVAASAVSPPPCSVTRGSYEPGPGVGSPTAGPLFGLDSCGSSRCWYLAPKPSELLPGVALAAERLCLSTFVLSAFAIVLTTWLLYEPGPTCAAVTASSAPPSRLSDVKWWSRPVFDTVLPSIGSTDLKSGAYAPGPGTAAFFSTMPGRCIVDANEELFIFSAPSRTDISNSLPTSVTLMSNAAGPGVSSIGPVHPCVGTLVAMLLINSTRFSVPPKPDLPCLFSVRTVDLAVV